jgi:hypothetical protein
MSWLPIYQVVPAVCAFSFIPQEMNEGNVKETNCRPKVVFLLILATLLEISSDPNLPYVLSWQLAVELEPARAPAAAPSPSLSFHRLATGSPRLDMCLHMTATFLPSP